ncbi:MAG: hypothetical protein KF763_17320 [Cyclobacteriaceae bacterium]|nr:hypothetical protein [Cyclobacteriaceae bacterium]
MVLVFLIIVGFAAISAVINAVLGSERGMTYFDMILTGIVFTPVMPLLICLTALLIDRK